MRAGCVHAAFGQSAFWNEFGLLIKKFRLKFNLVAHRLKGRGPMRKTELPVFGMRVRIYLIAFKIFTNGLDRRQLACMKFLGFLKAKAFDLSGDRQFCTTNTGKPAIAPRRTPGGLRRIKDDGPHAMRLGQLQGRIQAGIARADNGNIRRQITIQRRKIQR